MSSERISRSPDLLQLEDDGYEVEVTANNYLLVRHVPYANAQGQVELATLVTPLDLQGDVVAKPKDHTVLWTGSLPYDAQGHPMRQILAEENLKLEVQPGLVALFKFSQKPPEGYPNYYQKMVSYIHIIEGQAKAVRSEVTSQTRAKIVIADNTSVFVYRDTASTRAGISAVTDRLAKGRIAIVGMGGTGSYVLDFLAKTPVLEIHIFDGDAFMQHNAFRSPGAPSLQELRDRGSKVSRFAEVYSRMRRGIVQHPEFIGEANVASLSGMDFVFLCLDQGDAKRSVTGFLVEKGVPFIDVGMGLGVEQDALDGLVRVTTFAEGKSDHLKLRLQLGGNGEDPYSQNIQIAELNALNAALAIIKWKKLWHFYVESRGETNSTFWISENMLVNDGPADEKEPNPP